MVKINDYILAVSSKIKVAMAFVIGHKSSCLYRITAELTWVNEHLKRAKEWRIVHEWTSLDGLYLHRKLSTCLPQPITLIVYKNEDQ